MFKIQYQHRNSVDLSSKLIFSQKEYLYYLKAGEIRYPENWQCQLVLFGFIRINIK